MVDVMGNLLAVVVHAANIHDTKAGISAAKRGFMPNREFLSWCGHGDSNPNAVKHENLNLACLPIPSCPQI